MVGTIFHYKLAFEQHLRSAEVNCPCCLSKPVFLGGIEFLTLVVSEIIGAISTAAEDSGNRPPPLKCRSCFDYGNRAFYGSGRGTRSEPPRRPYRAHFCNMLSIFVVFMCTDTYEIYVGSVVLICLSLSTSAIYLGEINDPQKR